LPVRLFSVYSLQVQPSIRHACAQVSAVQEELHAFLQLLQDQAPSVVLGVGVARVRARGPLMMAWITYGGPDGADADPHSTVGLFPTPFPYSGHFLFFSGGMVQKLRALQQPEV